MLYLRFFSAALIFCSLALADSTKKADLETNDWSTNKTHAFQVDHTGLHAQKWDPSVDYDLICDYVPGKSPPPQIAPLTRRYALSNELELESNWIQRQYILRSQTGQDLQGFSGSVEWRVYDKMHHGGTSAFFLGGCTLGDGIDKNTRIQFAPKTAPRYLMDPIKHWANDHPYRGHISQASATISQWFSWKTAAGKFAIHLTYTEQYQNNLLAMPKKGWADRIVSNAECTLHFRAAKKKSHEIYLDPRKWAFYTQTLYGDGRHGKRQLLQCHQKSGSD